MQQHASTYSVLKHTLDPCGGVKRSKHCFTESSHVAYQINGNGTQEYHASTYFVLTHSPTPKWGQKVTTFLAHQSSQGELIVWDSSRRASVRQSTLLNINISETSWPIIIKFHQKHHWGRGLTVLGFRLDLIRTLVSMATDSSHRVIMGKIL